MAQRAPLVVVLGATACGKSKLAIELARRFRGEIISADSMQVYKGLDIVTNKVTEEEQKHAPHHMINFLDPMSRYSVIDFRNKSLDLINNLHRRQLLPIVVGGTNYYIESLLWKSFILGPTIGSAKRQFEVPEDIGDDSCCETMIDSEAKLLVSEESLHTPEDLKDADKFLSKRIYNDAFANVNGEILWQLLEKVDPDSAHRFHPNDKRRIIRSLQVIQEKKMNYSELLKEKNISGDGERASLGGPLRYDATLVIWLNSDSSTLNKVMDERVDAMLERGLLAELEKFHDDYNRRRLIEGKQPEYDKGIYQTIGFKEFHNYLMLDSDKKHSDEGRDILNQAIELMKISTRQYAKRQLKWIRRRFLQSGTRDLPPLFKLDTSYDEQGWLENVQKPAFDIVSSFLEDHNRFPDNLLTYKKEPEKQEMVNAPAKYNCEVCSRLFIGTHYINEHLNSRMHQKNQAKLKRRLERQATSETVEDDHKSVESTVNG